MVRVRLRVRDISSFGFGIWFSARQNNGSTSGKLPLAQRSDARLLTEPSVSWWSGPNVRSRASSARRYNGSALGKNVLVCGRVRDRVRVMGKG